ncbi:hypothetical protein, partial [Vibrio cholerae]|uniref:hypothetical protein n=1 Tax=Vibrio cholerae TaxID=666 RepID=UPI000A21AA14
PHFRGVHLKSELKNLKPKVKECGIVNLDSGSQGGTHWTAYRKNKNVVIYFDPFGIQPPKEVIEYFIPSKIYYTTEQIQDLNSTICGILCLSFLKNFAL